MGYETYINYLASMEAHAGRLVRDSHHGPVRDRDYARPKVPVDSKLLACVSVFTEGDCIPDIAAIDAVIEEGFSQIGIPQKALLYSKPTKAGNFEFMWRPGFPHDAVSAKQAIREVAARRESPCTSTGIYCGKPVHLFRYGKRSHLTEALKLGRFRIAPATSYNDLPGDNERQDDELSRTFERDPSSLTITTAAGVVLTPKGPVKFTSKMASDYYVLCLSMEFSRAIAEKFSGSEACLVINNPAEFSERLHASFEKTIPGYTGLDAPVSYGIKSKLGVCFTKTGDYTGQSEFRFAWANAKTSSITPKLTPVFVEIDSIEDIAKVVDLPLD